jgi:Peptidase family C54
MPESKHLSGLAKFFTDFSKVTLDQEKDLPMFLLNQLYILEDGTIAGR